MKQNINKEANAAAAKKDPVNVMASIIRMQVTLYKKEIASWKAAREEALDRNMPRRYLLTELYQDILTDGFVFGQMRDRILRVSNKAFKISNRKTLLVDKDKTELLQKQWFKKAIKLAMQSEFYGHSLIYINKFDTEVREVKLVYREHVVPERNLILVNPYDITGFDYTKPPYSNYVLEIGDPEDLGLLEKAAPLWILKKHSWANWDEFEEIFGIPIRVAKTASTDPKVKREIEKWLKAMGSAPYGIFPTDTELEIKESKGTDVFQVFDQKRRAANEELAMLINGQIETSTATGSRAKSENVVENTQGEITADDYTNISFWVNDKLIPLLAKLGYPFTDEDNFEFDHTKKLSPLEKADVYDKVNNWGFELDQSEIENTFNIKLLGKKEPIITPPAAGGEKKNLRQSK